MRRVTVLCFITILVVACSGPAATDAPSSPPASVASTTAPVSTPAPSVSAAASPSEATSPATAVTLSVDWSALDPSGIDPVESIIDVVRSGDTFVLVGSLPYLEDGGPNSVAWWSTDGTSWTVAQEFPASDRILAVTAGGPGFVAAGANDAGAAVWTSVDGRTWRPVSDSSLSNGVIRELVATDSGVVGFGGLADSDAGAIWTSEDGMDWLAATNETGMTVARGLEAVGAYDGRAIAFVSEGETKPPAIWETKGRAEWTRTGALKDVASIERVAGGTRGWVALGDNLAWTSKTGAAWSKGVPGPDVTSDVIVDDAGFVAVGYVGSLPGETCGDQRPFAGHTWTSADGKTWQKMTVTKEFKTAMVTELLVVDRTLLGYGQRVADDTFNGAFPIGTWMDTLPELTAPEGTSDEGSVFKSCGG